MEKLRKIEKGTDNNAFNWLLESNRNACESNNNSLMIRKLVERHNKMVAIINKLIIADVSKQRELLIAFMGREWHEDEIMNSDEEIVDRYLKKQ